MTDFLMTVPVIKLLLQQREYENTEVIESTEEEERFKRQYTNGFDIKYISWLKLNHPEADLSVYSTEESLIDFFPDASLPDAVRVCSSPMLNSTEIE